MTDKKELEIDHKVKDDIVVILKGVLNKVNKATREALNNIFKDPIFTPTYDISLLDMKELALARLKKVVANRVVSIKDFIKDPENVFTVHEMLGYIDMSLATKFTVQFNLFGGTIVGLGTAIHEKLYDDIDNLKIIGCFCLTEVGYGNNAVEMETVAVWNNDAFEVTTPTVTSQKFWITNGAYHANYGVVFAQTIIDGKNEGINAFIVRLRDDNGKLLKGVVIDDMGAKQGMNGVDNARIKLDKVRVSKEGLLNKLVNLVEADNTVKLVSKIYNRRARFLAASNRLLSGRICIASMVLSSTKHVLTITAKYGNTRLSNGKSGKSDTAISSFQLFQNQIIPLICRTIVLNICLLYIRNMYSDYLLNIDKYSNVQFNNVVRHVCVIKPLIAWHANKTGNICRERCGGMGYLSINNIEQLIPFAHASITAEGDSAVLMQKVSKEYVEDFNKNLVAAPKFHVEGTIDKKDLMDLNLLVNLIKFRESQLLKLLTEKTVKTNNIYGTWMNEENDLIQDLAKAYGERVALEQAIIKLKGNQ